MLLFSAWTGKNLNIYCCAYALSNRAIGHNYMNFVIHVIKLRPFDSNNQ
jgi:hypothetical protein